MPIHPPPELAAIVGRFDTRSGAFQAIEVQGEIEKGAPDPTALSPEARRGWWAEWAAFGFSERGTPDGGPWRTYFQPLTTATLQDGTLVCQPDLRDADADVLAYWAARARVARHPVLIARYADLVWDATTFVSKDKPGIEFARLAIDSYIAAARVDDGSAWSETHLNLGRALDLSLGIHDGARIGQAVEATIAYVEKTAQDDKVGTYCYLFDNLLPSKSGPDLTHDRELKIIRWLETKFAELTQPGRRKDADPHSPREVGTRLARYYQRKSKLEERARILRILAEAFERRAKIGEAMTSVLFLNMAREIYIDAGLRVEAERVQREVEIMGPAAERQLAPMRLQHEIPMARVEEFLTGMMKGGMEAAIRRLAIEFVPKQDELRKQIDQTAKDHPLYSILIHNSKLLNRGQIQADLGDESGDPDGKVVHETSTYMQFESPWLAWILDHMTRQGLHAPHIIEFIRPSPLFADDRLSLIRRGLEAHFLGDYVQSIHLLIPQIEAALLRLLPLAGKPTNKPHRSGRGVMQSKNLNDLLPRDKWPIPGEDGENLRMYLLAALAHPKGLNIRNDVCHGLWPADRFTKWVSERLVQVLLSISLVRPTSSADSV